MRRFKSIVVVAFAALVVVGTLAQTVPVAAQSSAALSIVPKKTYTVEPGKSVNDTLVIRNLDKEQSLNLSLRVVDFTFTDDGGTPKLMLAEDAPQTTWSLKPFLEVPKNIQVEPNKSETVDMKVSIPQNQGAGSYYSAIVYSTGASEGGNVGLSASGVTLVFTSIPGDVKENLTLEKFGAYQEVTAGKKPGYIFMAVEEPKSMAFTLKNDGNVTEAPVGSITIKDLFGNERIINQVNPNGSLALIGQSRTFVSCIELKQQEVDFNGAKAKTDGCDSAGLWPGYYSATLNLFYGQNGNQTQELAATAQFWYLPAWFLILLLIVISIVSFYVWKIYRKFKGGNTTTRYGTRSKNFARRR